MNRLLIVDDEHHIVNWLVELFETQTELDLTVLKAYTGMEALNILKVTKINIILLDINMPGITGLELADKILSDWPGCRIIFLTGFNNFDYVYYANKHNNISYLLKTEPDEEILHAVTNAVQALDKEVYEIELQNQMHNKEKLLNYLFQKEFLQDILLGKHLTEVKEHINSFEYDFHLDLMKPVYLLYGKCNENFSNSYSVDHNNYLLKLMMITEQLLYNKFDYALLDLDRTTILWFLQPSASFLDNNDQSPVVYIKECFDELISSIQKHFSVEVVLLLYGKEVSMDVSGNIYHLINQYVTFTALELSHSYGMLFGDEEEALVKEQDKKLPQFKQWESKLSNLSSYLNHGEKNELLALLNDIASFSKGIMNMNYLPLLSIYLQLSSNIITFINQSNLSDEVVSKVYQYPMFYISEYKSWEEAFHCIGNIIHAIFDVSNRSNSDKNQKIINSIKNYIRNHISEDLTLTTLSDHVNYNSSYVSRIFKQTTGLSLSDYINQCRLNKAKELLLETNDTIQVIAQKTGFDTSQYFSMVFRKAVGLTPRDFRNNNL